MDGGGDKCDPEKREAGAGLRIREGGIPPPLFHERSKAKNHSEHLHRSGVPLHAWRARGHRSLFRTFPSGTPRPVSEVLSQRFDEAARSSDRVVLNPCRDGGETIRRVVRLDGEAAVGR